ncbi:glycogen synthase [Patescibacteria group bacterium]
MSRQLRIVSVSSEVAPYSKTGGLGDVAKGLPRALASLRHHVSIFTPLYGFIQAQDLPLEKVLIKTTISYGNKKYSISIERLHLSPNFSVYFLHIPTLFGNRSRIYGYPDDNLRFLIFDLAVLKVTDLLQLKPHIIHCHDWQAGLIPNFLVLRRKQYPSLKRTRTLFTIHNLAFQAGGNWWNIKGRKRDVCCGFPPTTEQVIPTINFTKRAIHYADVINTVSVRYAEEILTSEFGLGLENDLQKREKNLYGIINGIDYAVYNPSFDSHIKHQYDWHTLDRKMKNKLALQKEIGFEQKKDIPLIGVVNRLSEQKGFALIMQTMDVLLRQQIQIVVVGSGRRDYISFFRQVARKYPKKIGIITPFTEEMASKVYAGSDLFLMPSRYEPCGISQLISMRYGSIPIVHETGGLSDTITNYNPRSGKGTGFVFRTYTSGDFLISLSRALETFKYRKEWEALVQQAMQQSYSWELPAKKYVTLYNIARRKTFLKAKI